MFDNCHFCHLFKCEIKNLSSPFLKMVWDKTSTFSYIITVFLGRLYYLNLTYMELRSFKIDFSEPCSV